MVTNAGVGLCSAPLSLATAVAGPFAEVESVEATARSTQRKLETASMTPSCGHSRPIGIAATQDTNHTQRDQTLRRARGAKNMSGPIPKAIAVPGQPAQCH